MEGLYQTKDIEFIKLKEEKGTPTYEKKTVAYCNVPDLIDKVCRFRRYERDKVTSRKSPLLMLISTANLKTGASMTPKTHIPFTHNSDKR